MLAAIVAAGPELQVEHAGERVSVLGGEGAREHVGSVEQLCAEQRQPASPGHAEACEVVGIRDLHALQPPEHPLWRVAPDRERVLWHAPGGCHARERGGHARRIVGSAGVPARLLDAEGARADERHVV